jgi:hypothetical protein
MDMKLRWIFALIAGVALLAADPALARSRHKAARCVDRPATFSLEGLLFFNGPPPPNGCSPPVHQYGRYVGQDPDANIRAQLRRDPQTGYTQF